MPLSTCTCQLPLCYDQDNHNDCNTVDESTGLPPMGWETEPSCVINARTTHTYCDGNGTPIYIPTSQFADSDTLLETWPQELAGAALDYFPIPLPPTLPWNGNGNPF